MSELTVENINVAEMYTVPGADRSVEKIKNLIDADPEASALIETAETVEDVFAIVKKFAKVTLEQLKVIFEKTVDYFKESKAVLADELLDNVVGGGLFDWWKKNRRDIVGWACFGACVLGGIIIGACTGGIGGAVVGAIGGGLAGATVGAVVNSVIDVFETVK